jgi:hypothetical protein
MRGMALTVRTALPTGCAGGGGASWRGLFRAFPRTNAHAN